MGPLENLASAGGLLVSLIKVSCKRRADMCLFVMVVLV